MRRWAAAWWIAVLLLGWASSLLTPRSASAQEKSYRINAVTIDATVLPNGALQVVEQRTFDFTGAWSWWEQWFPLEPDQRMEAITLQVDGKPYRLDSSGAPGTYIVERRPAQTLVKWHFQATDTQLTTEIRYTITNSVTVHNDVAELYRGFIGKEWDEPTGRAVVRLHLPHGAEREQIRAWGHGPLTGFVSIESGSQVTWQADGLARRTFLEGRVTFPPVLVPGATRRSGRDGLELILAEEMGWAEQANRQRLLARIDLGVAALVVPLTAFMLWWRFGRVRGAFKGPYYRELPSAHTPAEVGVLFRSGSGALELKATILDLARRQYIRLEPAGVNDMHVRWTGTQDYAILKPYEQRLLDFLFGTVAGGRQELQLSALSAYAHRHRFAASAFMNAWQAEVDHAARDCGFWEEKVRSVGCLVPAVILAGVCGAALAGWLFTVAALIFATMAAGVASLGRHRTPLGEDELSKWVAFRRFLTHFSRLDLAQVPSLVLWEQYLVYATVLGVAKQVLKQMKAVLPLMSAEQRAAWQGNLLSSRLTSGGELTSLDRLSNALDRSVSDFSRFTSGAGHGGGFSAGGGGGAGSGGGGRGG